MNKNFNGVWISDRIRKIEDITWNEKIYLALIEQYGKVQAKDLFLMICSKRTETSAYANLKSRGYITESWLTPEEAKEQTIKKSHKGMVCEWCGQECYTLHEHHYPISAQKGGTETVKICPNCHYTFHSLVGRDY